jgi:hypothetical protein
MQLKVVSSQGVKNLNELKTEDLILCEGGIYLPIKNIVMISGYPTFFRTSNNLSFHISKRIQLKTDKGFKCPELWDTLIFDGTVTPMVTTVKLIERTTFFYDILIDGNIVSPEGIIFRYSE